MKCLHELCSLSSDAILDVIRRGEPRQQPQRLLEQQVRSNVVNLSHEIGAQGYTVAEAAALLNLRTRTLRHWQAQQCRPLGRVLLLGRPLLRAPVHLRNEVIDLLDELGPATGLPTLRDCFPDLARAELEDILRRYRRVWRKLNVQAVHRLRWPIPGRVWAMDFTEADHLIDGIYPYLLAVRDLASGNQLLWLPVPDLTAAVAQGALASLFVLHGAPLVLKMDNGSAFIAEATRELLTPWGVIPLFSPPYCPRYNGAIEAGIGSLKTRTQHQADRHGVPAHWSFDNVAAARLEANATSRPHGDRGPTADDLWQARTRITPEERDRFQAALGRRRREARQEAGRSDFEELSPREHRSLDRNAIRRTLVELGYLLFRRRRIPLPIKKQKMTNI